MHPILVFLVFIWNHIIHLSSTLFNIHQGLIKIKIPLDPQQPWQQLNNYLLICTTFPQPPSLFLYLFSKKIWWSIIQIFPESQVINFFEIPLFAFVKHFISPFYAWMSI
jgi:hypothetical protein